MNIVCELTEESAKLGVGHLIPGGGVWFFRKKFFFHKIGKKKIVCSIKCGRKIICFFMSKKK